MANDLIQRILMGQSPYNTPGINPAAPPVGMPSGPSAPSPSGGLSGLLNKPGGMFLANLLAQSGYSTMPQSPFGAIGRAALATQQQGQQGQLQVLQRQLMESQIGLNKARANPGSAGPNIGAVSPDKYTPESLRQFQQTGDFGVLQPTVGNGADLNKLTNELADDVRAESKDYAQQRAAYTRITASATDPTPAGDLALIFNYMKVLDPGSTVREGEFANAQNSGSVPQRIRALYNQVIEGTRLSAPQRADFVRKAGQLFNASAKEQMQLNERFRKRGRNSGLPDQFIDPLLPPAEMIELGPMPEFGSGDDEMGQPTGTGVAREL